MSFTFSPGVVAFNEYYRDMQFTTPYMKYTAYSNRYFIVPDASVPTVFWRAQLVTHDDQNELTDRDQQLDQVIEVRKAHSLRFWNLLLEALPLLMSEDVVDLIYQYLVVGKYQVCDTFGGVNRMYPLDFVELPPPCPVPPSTEAWCHFTQPSNMCWRCYRIGFPVETTLVIMGDSVTSVTERGRMCEHGRVTRSVNDCCLCYPCTLCGVGSNPVHTLRRIQ